MNLEYLKEIVVGTIVGILTEKIIKWIYSYVFKKKKTKKEKNNLI